MGEADDVRAVEGEGLTAARSAAEPATDVPPTHASDPSGTHRPTPERTVEVPLRRLGPWLAGFGRRHPDVSVRALSDRTIGDASSAHRWELTSADGHRALIEVPEWLTAAMRGGLPDGLAPAGTHPGVSAVDRPDQGLLNGGHPAGEDFGISATSPGTQAGEAAEALLARIALAGTHEAEVTTFAVLVIRRAGYAAAVFRGQQRLWGKVGRRHVHGRTAAGGWSQQRYARRRANQADEIVGALASSFAEGVGPHTARLDALVTGGDRALVSQVRALLARTDRRLDARLAELPEVRVAIGTPSTHDLAGIPDRVLAARIHLTDTTEPGGPDD